MMRVTQVMTAIAAMIAAAGQVQAGTLYSNGFETDTAGWDFFGGAYNATRVPSGTTGITSASGSFHAESSTGSPGSAGNWGGYNFGAGNNVPTSFQEYTTSADIFLNVAGGWANDTRFDYDSAVSNAAGGFLRDFVFNGGFYDDSHPTGTVDRFVFSASNNAGRANSYPKNPARDPYSITSSGWYTFQHHFYDNAGVLSVDLSILDSATNSLLHSWTLSDPTDLIAGVGGNRYGWFVTNEFSTLAFDNTSLTTPMASTVPEPASMATFGFGACLMGLGAFRRRRARVQHAT